MSSFTPGITAVVVNYQTPSDLAGFCQSYEEFAPADSELVIVNVDPTEDDLDVANEFSFSQHIVAQVNVGYANACNRAARQTRREVLALFNADTRLRQGVLAECATALLDNDDWGVLGPRQVNEDGCFTHAGIIGDRSRPAHRGWMELDHGQYAEVLEVPTVSGAAYFVKRRVWDELTLCPLYQQVFPHAEGAFLPTKHYYEETWCSYHAIEHGWKVVYYGPVTMEHHWHKASAMGVAEQWMDLSRQLFRTACDAHSIPHD